MYVYTYMNVHTQVYKHSNNECITAAPGLAGVRREPLLLLLLLLLMIIIMIIMSSNNNQYTHTHTHTHKHTHIIITIHMQRILISMMIKAATPNEQQLPAVPMSASYSSFLGWHIHINTYIYIYIYMFRETYAYIYIERDIHTYTHVHM